jgi:large subunit ribosomal protein L24
MVARIKKNDLVRVITGKDKNKEGSVIQVLPKKGKVLVKDVAVITRHVKPRKTGEPGGIRKEESYIRLSKVMPVCTACKKAARVSSKQLESGKRARMCSRCKEIF